MTQYMNIIPAKAESDKVKKKEIIVVFVKRIQVNSLKMVSLSPPVPSENA